MKKPFDFKNSTALIIGGGSGIGKEISRSLCEHGANVIIAGRENKKLVSTINEINDGKEGRCSYHEVDVKSEKSVENLMSHVRKVFDDKLNILVNSAGTNIRSPIKDVALTDFKEVLDTNLTGTFLTTKAAQPLLKAANYGRVINLASIFASVSYPDRLSYASSKAGILLFSKTIALEWALDNITVNTISPGPLLTEINKKVLEDKKNYNKFCERIPMRRFGESYEVITAALFLASPMSGYITGSDIVVDGGWTSS
ncbi:SDR family oxidoreductase [Gammaproteobacteria bacterium]|nr:SDR family oxidoreductase [Gammaproteobacteria bacterium]